MRNGGILQDSSHIDQTLPVLHHACAYALHHALVSIPFEISIKNLKNNKSISNIFINFEDHINSVVRKLRQQSGIISKIGPFKSYQIVLIRPIIEHGILVYGCTTYSKLDRTLKLQKKDCSYNFVLEIQGINIQIILQK